MMDAKIDYLSWTIMEDCRATDGQGDSFPMAIDTVRRNCPDFFERFAECRTWEQGGARGHYGSSFFQPQTYAAIRFGGKANHVLIELPGTACQALSDVDCVGPTLIETNHRCTRIDIAVDVPHGCTPTEFVQAGYNERFKSHASLVSESGTTEYVGSMKSERFARAYMYAPPHPRAGTLRIEHVMRSEYGKATVQQLLDVGLKQVVCDLGGSFGWMSEAWAPDCMTIGKLRAARSDRHEPGRVRWLYNVVLPAIVRADKEGLISLDDFIERAKAH